MKSMFLQGEILEVIETQRIRHFYEDSSDMHFENVYLGEEVSDVDIRNMEDGNLLSTYDDGFSLLFPRGTQILILGYDCNGNVGFEVLNNPRFNAYNVLFDLPLILGDTPRHDYASLTVNYPDTNADGANDISA